MLIFSITNFCSLCDQREQYFDSAQQNVLPFFSEPSPSHLRTISEPSPNLAPDG